MGKIVNTSTRNLHPFDGLPGAIEASEKAGQRQLVGSTQLPVDVLAKDKAALEAAGVRFGAVTDGDPIFQEATLPTGWNKRATEHPMWSELVDDKGTVRAKIFYKAAFYDRSAFMRLA